MSKNLDARHLNIQALADSEKPLTGSTPLHKLERLATESIGANVDIAVNWEISAQSRVGAGGQPDLWLHVQAQTVLALTCQRCMAPSSTPIAVNQWFRFVADEEVAMAEDDASEEDLLVMTPQFDALQVIEDELLMALPLVPMHDECPVLPVFSAGAIDGPSDAQEKSHPFAALTSLIKK